MIEQHLPFKSTAGVLIFCVFLGPIGLLYGSVLAGIIMMIAGLLIIHYKLIMLIILVWLVSCVWGVVAVNRYNEKVLLSCKKQ